MRHNHLCDSADCEPIDFEAMRAAYRQRYQGTSARPYLIVPGPRPPGRLRFLRGVGIAALLALRRFIP